MKTKLFTLCLTLLVIAGCKKEIRLEVKNIRETDNTSEWNIRIDRSVFSATEEKTEKSCVKFNDEVTGLINGIKAGFMEQTRESVAFLDSVGEKQIAPYELIIKDTVFLADNRYISIRLLVYQFTGGAHGMTNFYAVNYDVPHQKFLQNKEILEENHIRDLDAQLKANLKNPDHCFDQTPTAENATTLNFTRHSLEFTYAQYVLGPYSCGYTTISVPRNKMGNEK